MGNPQNRPKNPPLSNKTKLLSFDLETNGLHGKAFAVGAVLMDRNGKVHDEFSARSPLVGAVDPWVKANVLPAIADMPITHSSYVDLREAFWKWYVAAEAKADYVLVKNGYPVEYRFLLDCQEANLKERYWQHPFPILDLSSLLIQVGQNPLAHRPKLEQKLATKDEYLQHHPLHDAKLAAMVAFEAFRSAGRL
jgi:hypothetical protein